MSAEGTVSAKADILARFADDGGGVDFLPDLTPEQVDRLPG